MNGTLGLGKVTREVFNRSVLPYFPVETAIELDGAITNLSGNTVIAHAPSIGVPIEALGFFAFHYSASNVAAKFGKPSQLISGIYLPLKTTEDELQIIAKGLGDEARKYGVTITAGQTGTYYGLDIPLLTATCLGECIGTPINVKAGDTVFLVGEVGGEAFWLDMISSNIQTNEIWKKFTPLPTILSLQNVRGIKLIHDVSEGGVIGSLFEVATTSNYGIEASSEGIVLYPGAEKLSVDIMRSPSYGSLIVIAEPEAVEDVKTLCIKLGVSCCIIGEVTIEHGLIFDSQLINKQERINLDEIYGSFTQKDTKLID
jgi:hydrogenase maturation factor